MCMCVCVERGRWEGQGVEVVVGSAVDRLMQGFLHLSEEAH